MVAVIWVGTTSAVYVNITKTVNKFVVFITYLNRNKVLDIKINSIVKI